MAALVLSLTDFKCGFVSVFDTMGFVDVSAKFEFVAFFVSDDGLDCFAFLSFA